MVFLVSCQFEESFILPSDGSLDTLNASRSQGHPKEAIDMGYPRRRDIFAKVYAPSGYCSKPNLTTQL